jgi:hypothetical protein
MRPLILRSLILFGMTLAALVISSHAQATPFHVILWHNTMYCEIRDESIPSQPWPSNYSVISETLLRYSDAQAYKANMIQKRICAY